MEANVCLRSTRAADVVAKAIDLASPLIEQRRPTTRELGSEIWHDIGPRIQHVLKTGEATWNEALLLLLERNGYPDETQWLSGGDCRPL